MDIAFNFSNTRIKQETTHSSGDRIFNIERKDKKF